MCLTGKGVVLVIQIPELGRRSSAQPVQCIPYINLGALRLFKNALKLFGKVVINIISRCPVFDDRLIALCNVVHPCIVGYINIVKFALYPAG